MNWYEDLPSGFNLGDETEAAATTHRARWPEDQSPEIVIPSPVLVGLSRVMAPLTKLDDFATLFHHSLLSLSHPRALRVPRTKPCKSGLI